MRLDFPGQQNQDFRYLSPELRRRRWTFALDAGCGHGLYARELAAGAGVAIGMDRSIDNLRRVNLTNGRRRVVAAQLQQLPYRDALFDLILCIEVLTHIPPVEQSVALAEMFRVLRPGGVLLISVHNLTRHRAHRMKRRLIGGNWTRSGAEVFPVSVARFREMLERSGFDMRAPIHHLNFFNRFGFEMAHRRPRISACMAWLEDVMTHVPGIRDLSITVLFEGTKPSVA